jgi:hypothetical protein
MTLRPPRPHCSDRGASALDYEIAQEQAAALGRLGRALEAALAALSRYDRAQADRGENPAAEATSTDPLRLQLLHAASDALWCFVVQREACGLRDQRLIVRAYGVPAEVQNRMGAFGTRSRPRPNS